LWIIYTTSIKIGNIRVGKYIRYFYPQARIEILQWLVWLTPLPKRGIRTLSWVVTIEAIIKTPLVQQVTEDRLVWKAEKNGHYSVKCLSTMYGRVDWYMHLLWVQYIISTQLTICQVRVWALVICERDNP